MTDNRILRSHHNGIIIAKKKEKGSPSSTSLTYIALVSLILVSSRTLRFAKASCSFLSLLQRFILFLH
ncbi:hypothetical protein Peur_071182 [Populus x canadensis]